MRSELALTRPLAGLLAAIVALSGLFVGACPGREPTADSPEGAVTLFLQSMRRRDRVKAYGLLAPEAQSKLQKRAATATKQGGRTFEPAEMLVTERFVPRWEVSRTEASIKGRQAVVTVQGPEKTQTAKIDLVEVDGTWRVVLPGL